MKKKFILTDEYKQNAFRVPENYFDTLQNRLAERMAAKSQPQTGWWQTVRPRLAFAASFVMLAIIGYSGIHLYNNTKGLDTHDTSYVYVVDMLNLDENAVLNLFAEEDRHDLAIDTDVIINYLADAGICLTDIASLD